MMSLQEAIEEVKVAHDGADFLDIEIALGKASVHATAIAIILNAVVKGELKHVGD